MFDKNPEHRNCNSSDRVYVAAINAVRCEAVLSLPVYRRMGSITVMLPSCWEGEEVHLYGFVQDSAGRCSESCYLGTVEEMEECSRDLEDPKDSKDSKDTKDPRGPRDPRGLKDLKELKELRKNEGAGGRADDS